ncbi:protein cortex isoform X4 [Anastrepha ludens]|uniref:protein cortex isoform X4 n=1 Tax=Anastrepha ludens TaxID=28586 RepID=UPI0023B1A69E|nr:protein cortex isoform X4 [Anastrepha ludens]
MNVYTACNYFKSEMIDNPKAQKKNSSIKKRGSQWQNEVIKMYPKEIGITALSYGDRFIPRRYFSDSLKRNLKFVTKNMEKDVLKVRFAANYWRQNSLKIAINKVFKLKEERILHLSDQIVKGLENNANILECLNEYSDDYDWRCIPRSKPLAFAETTHDSPGFDSTFVLELWKAGYSTKFVVVNGKVFSADHSDLHSIVWNPTGTQVICGTGSGCLYILSVPDLKVLRKVHRHKMPIVRIKISPHMRYLASGDTGGNIVIYNWSSCDVYLVVCSKRKLHTDFDWHPWNGEDLVIAEMVPASIVMLHVPSKEIVAYYQRKDRRIIINYITFSKITAELLVSVSMADDDGCWEFKILVMSSLNRVVDLLYIHESGARFVVWSPDGTRLATSGNDETLTIWNFCPEIRTDNSTLGITRDVNCCSLDAKFGRVFNSWACLK